MIKVCSYKRSGTHILMANLWRNFKIDGGPRHIQQKDKIFRIGGQKTTLVPWAGLFGTHMPANRLKEHRISPDKVIYIVRDPREVLYSLWWFENRNKKLNKWIGPQIRKWEKHVQGYIDAGSYIVRYEDLIRDFPATMTGIEENFPLIKRGSIWTPVTKKVGWVNKKFYGTPGDRPRIIDEKVEELLSKNFWNLIGK